MEEVKCGNVTILDNRGRSQPVQIQLTKDTLSLYKEEIMPVFSDSDDENDILNKIREVTVEKGKDGLGLCLKGGSDHRLPPLISKLIPGQAAANTAKLYIGDAILKINGDSCEGKTHDEVIQMLRCTDDVVVLTVQYFKPAALFLNKDQSNVGTPESDVSSGPRIERQWNLFITVPVLFAYLTRFINGTDKLRTNAFEVIGVNGSSTGVLHCEDSHSLADWIRAITTNINALILHMIKLSNRLLIPEQQIVYMSWTHEKMSPSQHTQAWKPKFLALKGSEVFLFDIPPMQSRDWVKCNTVFKVYECMFKVLRDNELFDDRQHCCTILAGTGERVYLSTQTRSDLLHLEKSWYRVNHSSITRLKNRTFGCLWRGNLSGLTLDLEAGFALYDNQSKKFMWTYKFSQLKSSSDDGRTKLKLHFCGLENTASVEVREIECTNLQTLLYCMHAFLSAKLASVDPTFLTNY